MPLLSASETASRLGVKTATVYSYVSRGVLERHVGSDGKSSAFDSRQVEALARRGRPRLSSQPGSVHLTIESALTSIRDDGVYFRGYPASLLLQAYTFEEVAQLLWRNALPSPTLGPWLASGPVVRSGSLPQRLRVATARSIADNAAWLRPSSTQAAQAGQALVQTMIGALPVLRAVGGSSNSGDLKMARLELANRMVQPGKRALGQRRSNEPLRVVKSSVAAQLWPRLTAQRASVDWIYALNALLVLLADHELASSTLAVRVAASTHASPAAAVLAGLGVMEGPLHGAASRHARDLILEAHDVGAEAAVRRRQNARERIPGFGHRVYPAADPRALIVLRLLRTVVPKSRYLVVVDDIAREVRDYFPNIDLLLAAFELAADMVPDSSEVIFSIARTAGWIAHAIEEYEQPPLRFRARAQYIGPKPAI